MKLDQFLNLKAKEFEEQLDALLPEQNVPYDILFKAARYSLLGGAKRLRPLLALATLHDLGRTEPCALKAVAALEMVHTYSLIHDDLPCMDDDDFRRGKPSLHKAFDEGLAVLSGDFLLTYAFDVLTHLPLPPEKRIKLLSILSTHSGSKGMIGGQVMDLDAEGKVITLDHLKMIHLHKTGALITASIAFGGILGDASPDEMEALKTFGNHLGLAFQIADDILDVTESEKKHGKKVSSDTINQKSTYVSLLGLQKANTLAEEALETSIRALKQIPKDTSLLQELSYKFVKLEKKR